MNADETSPQEWLQQRFKPAPSPWTGMKAQVFFTFARASNIPAASYGDLEGSSAFSDPDTSGKFKGGLCVCMIVRYLETPVGPYDEIIWFPGAFQDPRQDTSKKRYRITRIYVSRRESVYNGRKNWNIPKTLANFEFIPSNCKYPPYRQINISLPDKPNQPFVSLNFQSIPLISRPILPISTAYIPMNLDIVMPPIPQRDDWKESGLVGTDEWRSDKVVIAGNAGIIRAKGKVGDGDAYPELNMDGLWFWVNAKITCSTIE